MSIFAGVSFDLFRVCFCRSCRLVVGIVTETMVRLFGILFVSVHCFELWLLWPFGAD